MVYLQIQRHQCNATGITNNQGNMIPSKVQNGSPVTNPKEIEISKLPDKKIQNNHLRESQ